MQINIKTIPLTAMLVALLFSCNPVPTPERLEQTPISAENETVINITAASESAEILFTPVYGAESYEVGYGGSNSSDERTITVQTSSYGELGMFKTILRPLNPSTDYTVRIYAKNSANTDFIKIGEKEFTTATAGMLSYRPTAWLESRNKNDAVIAIDTTEGFYYSVMLKSSTGDTLNTFTVEDGHAHITGLEENDSYVAEVSHGTEEDLVSNLKTEISIPSYSIAYDSSFTLSYKNGMISFSGIPEGTTGLELYKSNNGVDILLDSADQDASGFNLNQASSFESAIYHITASTPTGPVSSLNLLITSGVLINNMEIGYQDIELNWDTGEYAEDEVIYAISVTNGNGTDPVINGNTATLDIKNLQSGTEYDISIEAFLPDKRVTNTSITLKTKDFSGVYQWTNTSSPKDPKVGNFVVTVENAPEQSEYHYYISVNSQDCYYDETPYRILPLIDNTYDSGETMPSGMIPYGSNEKYGYAYRWNAGKWNTTTQSPDQWKITSTDISTDIYKTTVASTLAILQSELPTNTTWTFTTDSSGDPILYFKNYSSNFFVAMGLYTNPNYKSEGVDKYTFTLKRIADI